MLEIGQEYSRIGIVSECVRVNPERSPCIKSDEYAVRRAIGRKAHQFHGSNMGARCDFDRYAGKLVGGAGAERNEVVRIEQRGAFALLRAALSIRIK